MTNIELKKIYQKLNKKRKKKILFELTNRGFLSEINGILLGILYCLVYEKEFVIYSRNWVASNNKGWEDYFLPFCDESTSRIIKFFYMTSLRMAPLTTQRRIRWVILGIQELLFFPQLLKNFNNKTASIWHKIRNPQLSHIWYKMISPEFLNREFNIPELNIKGDIYHAKQKLLEIIYHYNDETNKAIQTQNKLLNSIKPYAALHIRRGDKTRVIEKTVDVSEYIEKIKKVNSKISNIFIATDDYRTIKEFKSLCPSHWRVITFCNPNEIGYDQSQFNKKNKKLKKQDMINLFIDIHFLTESEFFIGTYTSNISMFLALRKGREKIYSLDRPNWTPW